MHTKRLPLVALASVTLLAANAVGQSSKDKFIVLGYNDLGMHCMNQDLSRLCILPPYNSLHAQVIRRGEEPSNVTSNIEVRYRIPGNTESVTKTNFWSYSKELFRTKLNNNIGLTGNGLVGKMAPTGAGDWAATGIPLTPIDDDGHLNAYQLSEIKVIASKKTVATTHAVVPVSWEISCNICHAPGGTGEQVELDILNRHDRMHNTSLATSATAGHPVLCASCHADAALGTKGKPGVKSMSQAMHGAHANRMGPVAKMGNAC